MMVGQRGVRGKTYVFEGPEDYTVGELAEFVFDITGQRTKMPPLPDEVVKGIGKVMGMQPNPLFTEDQAVLWGTDYVYEGGWEGK